MEVFDTIDRSHPIDQGDIFVNIRFPATDSNLNAVVITPTCDLVQDKAPFVKFVGSVPLDFVVRIIADSVSIDDSFFTNKTPLTNRQQDNFLKAFRRNLTGDFLPRYYLIRSNPGSFTQFYLDFQRVFVFARRQVEEEFLACRCATIASPWREQIVSQYAGYSMRIGTPDYSQSDISSLMDGTNLIFPTNDISQI